jgi:hypothetical protein
MAHRSRRRIGHRWEGLMWTRVLLLRYDEQMKIKLFTTITELTVAVLGRLCDHAL